MLKDDSWFFDWYWRHATEEEKQLHDRYSEFCDTDFNDMVFGEGSITLDLIKCKSKSMDSDEWQDDYVSLPDELEYFNPNWFHTEIADLGEGACGQFDREKQTITIAPDCVDEDSHLLHEIIHLYEYIVNELPLYYHDMLIMALYLDLRDKIVGLDDAITQHSHLLNGQSIERYGGVHDILFLLKSFDLDIRHGYEFGTVFGYGRVDDFSFLKLAETAAT